MTLHVSPTFSKPTHTLVLGITTLLLVLTFLVPPDSQAQMKPPYAKPTLLEGLKQSARDKKLSSHDFVRLIEQRGVDFQMTTPDEAQLRMAGASDEVIAAVRANYRHVPKRLPKGTGSLTINSFMSDCKVLINGQLRGTTDLNGVLTLPPLKAAQYRVLLRKESYEDQSRMVQITAGVETSESFKLTPLKGRLTIVPVPAAARIAIRGLDYTEGVRNLALEPGSYKIHVSKEGYKSDEREVNIAPGQQLSVPIALEVLRVEELLKESIASLQQKDFSRAIALTRDILSAKPEEPKANLVLGLSYFHSGNYDAAASSLIKAILLGEQVRIPVKRHTKYGLMIQSDNLTQGELLISKNVLEFRVSGGSSLFSVPYDKVYRVIQEDNRGGRIQLKIGDPKKKKDDGKDHNFHPMQAQLRQVFIGSTPKIEIYCENCLPVTQAIYQIIQQVKLSSHGAIPSKL